jgi:hypothetical protein
MAPIRVRFSPEWLQEQDFPESNLITAEHVGKKLVFREAYCSSVVLELRWSIPLRSLSYAEAVLSQLRATLEQSSPYCELRWSRLR